MSPEHCWRWALLPNPRSTSWFLSRRYYAASAVRPTIPSDVQFRPDKFKATMFIVVDDSYSPSHGKSGDFLRGTAHHRATLFGFPKFNLHLVLFSMRWKGQKQRCTYHLNRMSALKPFDLPLLTIRYVKHRQRIPTYEPPSLPEPGSLRGRQHASLGCTWISMNVSE